MQRMRVRLRSASRAETDGASDGARAARAWGHEWHDADAADRLETEREPTKRTSRALAWVTPAAGLAAAAPAVFPLTPGFSADDVLAATVAAAGAAGVSVSVVPTTSLLVPGVKNVGARDAFIFTLALLSAGAAAIHFVVAKMHFDEYTLFGVFFVISGLAQLVWPIWLLLSRWRPLLALGALGNGLIVVLWAADRIWGLPLGPEHWKPDPIGFGDSVTAAFEVLLVSGCLWILARGRQRPLRPSVATALTLAVAVATALSLLSVLGVGSSFLKPTE